MSQMSLDEQASWGQRVGELALQAGEHPEALTVLLGAYLTIAMAHPCCHQPSANNLMRAAMVMARMAAQAGPQPGQKVH